MHNNNTENMIEVVSATDIGNLNLSIRFNDGTVKTVDIGQFIRNNPHPQHNRFLKPENFAKFKIEDGNVVWGKNWDLSFHVEDLYSGIL